MVGGPDVKVSTVDVESGDNMATLPVSRGGHAGGGGAGSGDTAEKNNAANKEMELKNVVPKPLQRCVLFSRVFFSRFYYGTVRVGVRTNMCKQRTIRGKLSDGSVYIKKRWCAYQKFHRNRNIK